MVILRVFDWLFVNHMFSTNGRGETVFYPNGRLARGYVMPPEREAGVRAGFRWLVLVVLAGSYVLAVLVPDAIEAWLGFELPLAWFIGWAVAAFTVAFVAIMRALARLTVGLEPAVGK